VSSVAADATRRVKDPGRIRVPWLSRADRVCPFFASADQAHFRDRGVTDVRKRRSLSREALSSAVPRCHLEVADDRTISGKSSSQESHWNDPRVLWSIVLDARYSSASCSIAGQTVALVGPCSKAVPCGHSRRSISCRWHHPPSCSPSSSQARCAATQRYTGCLRLREPKAPVRPD
jgi:hypothetical protein